MTANAIRVFVVLDSGVDRTELDTALPSAPQVEIVGISDTLETVDAAHHADADAVVVACAGHSERALLVVDASVREHPERPVIVLAYGAHDGFLRRVFEAGADDIVDLPEDRNHVLFALQKALVRKRGTMLGSSGLAPLITVLGPKGGAGKTLTSTNLAVAFATSGARTALVDLDLQFGDVGLALGLTPERTLADLARAGGAIDDEKIDAYLTEHTSGLQVLLAPTRPDHAALVNVDFLRDLLAALRGSFDYVVVDTPPGFTSEVIATVDHSTHVVMVAVMDALSLKNTKLGLETLDLMGFGSDRVALVLNRADSRVGLEPDDVAAVLGRPPDLLVPSDREIPRSVNEGVPIVLKERSEAAKTFRDLARRYPVRRANGGMNGAVAREPARRRLTLSLGRKT